MAYVHRVDDNRSTRFWCKTGLAVSCVLSIVAIGVGVWLMTHLKNHELSFHLLPFKEVFPLGVNIFVTLLNDSMGYIHTCTLRWTLQREGRLDFNTNLRLLSFSHTKVANSWYANLAYMFGIILVYSSTSMIFQIFNGNLYRTLHNADGKNPVDIDGSAIHVNPFAVLAFGVGLLMQATITLWALLSTEIPSWSSHPLVTVHECIHGSNNIHPIFKRPGRCVMSVHMANEKTSSKLPISPQLPMMKAHRYVKWVFGLFAALPVCGVAWFGVVFALIYTNKNTQVLGVLGKLWGFMPDLNGTIYGTGDGTNSVTNTTALGPCHATSCTTGTSILNIRWTSQNYESQVNIATVFCVAGFQTVLTVSLHCAELLVNLSRDEAVVRKLTSQRGIDVSTNSIWAAMRSWQTWTFFFFKAGVHWMFGLALSASWRIGICMHAPQILYCTGICSSATAFAWYLAYQKHEGFLPSTFDHIQTIADLIDEWNDTGAMFWGHKYNGDGRATPNFAGTGTKYLPPPHCNREYGSLVGSARVKCNQYINNELITNAITTRQDVTSAD